MGDESGQRKESVQSAYGSTGAANGNESAVNTGYQPPTQTQTPSNPTSPSNPYSALPTHHRGTSNVTWAAEQFNVVIPDDTTAPTGRAGMMRGGGGDMTNVLNHVSFGMISDPDSSTHSKSKYLHPLHRRVVSNAAESAGGVSMGSGTGTGVHPLHRRVLSSATASSNANHIGHRRGLSAASNYPYHRAQHRRNPSTASSSMEQGIGGGFGPLRPTPRGPGLTRQTAFRSRVGNIGGGPIGLAGWCRWLMNGYRPAKVEEQSDEDFLYSLQCLAQMLILLREYLDRFGMPEEGGPKDQEYVLREMTKDLYAGGVPIWALETGMQMAAEGLTGKKQVDFFILPRKAFIFAPSSGATSMFRITRGFDMQRLVASEMILMRMASFASNTPGVEKLEVRMPSSAEFTSAISTSERYFDEEMTEEELADEILDLASDSEGLYFYINNVQAKKKVSPPASPKTKEDDGTKDKETKDDDDIKAAEDSFWTVESEAAELFTRLATIETMHAIDRFDDEKPTLYPKWAQLMFRFVSSAGACGFWFSGSWVDILVGGCCGVGVGLIATWSFLTREERILFEAIASFVVGAVAGLVAMFFPSYSCFNAIALSGVLDILQGFRVVYAIIELMSRHTVSGCADFFEGIFFTVIVAAFLQLGRATVTFFSPHAEFVSECTQPIAHYWYILLVPLASMSWCGLFNPEYVDLPRMTFHSVLAFSATYGFGLTSMNSESQLFLAAIIVTLSSGLFSRFGHRSSISNSVGGLYVLLPGAYMVTNIYQTKNMDWLGSVFIKAGSIGLGAWTGTILCSPTVLGATKGAWQNKLSNASTHEIGALTASVRRDKSVKKNGTGAMLFF